jgi:hypothetical protein
MGLVSVKIADSISFKIEALNCAIQLSVCFNASSS